jgi:Domain of unknown function (DUF4291)
VTPPYRQVRASFDAATVVVYQAYAPPIADAALAAGTFVSPFKIERMTWIKPSFLWMMYRCGWAEKPGQERVLAMRMARSGFEDALRVSCLSHFDAEQHGTYEAWQECKAASPVRVQWDPERTLSLAPQPWRSLQVGLSGRAVRDYVGQWIVGLADVTDVARAVKERVDADDEAAARALLPREDPYPLPPDVAVRVGADG